MQIAFIGYGELGMQVHELIRQVHSQLEAIFFDDMLFQKKENNVFPFEAYSEERFKNYSFVIGLGYRHFAYKQKVLQCLNELGRNLFSFVHSSCFVSPSAMIGAGTVAYPLCNIDRQVKIGEGVLLNNSVIISHNSIIGDGCYLSPGVIVSGNVTIGMDTFIGSGSVIANNINIGNKVVIGIGTVVTQNIADGACVIGNPMSIVKKLHLV